MSPRARRVALIAALACVILAVAAAAAIRRFEVGQRPAEAARLAGIVGLRPGMTVAEVGAGSGALAAEMARLVGPDGKVIATELGEAQLAALRARRAALPNLTVLAAGEHETNLQGGCCDVVYMHWVYHHLTDPAAVIASAMHALKPSGRLAVIEFDPNWIRNWSTPRGVPDRGGHGVPKDMLVREMKSFGLTLEGDIVGWNDWSYLAVFGSTADRGMTRPRRTRSYPVFAATRDAAATLPFEQGF